MTAPYRCECTKVDRKVVLPIAVFELPLRFQGSKISGMRTIENWKHKKNLGDLKIDVAFNYKTYSRSHIVKDLFFGIDDGKPSGLNLLMENCHNKCDIRRYFEANQIEPNA
jgi:hypothetical protein